MQATHVRDPCFHLPEIEYPVNLYIMSCSAGMQQLCLYSTICALWHVALLCIDTKGGGGGGGGAWKLKHPSQQKQHAVLWAWFSNLLYVTLLDQGSP